MFRAIARYFRAFGYLITGRVDAARRELSRNPYVVRATYDNIIEEKRHRINQYKDAVARMIAQEEKKVARVKTLSDEVNRLEQLKQGAAAKARKTVDELKAKGMSMEQIRKNEDYLRCMTAFNDFSSTAQEKNQHIGELEEEARQLGESVKGHKIQLQQLLREIEKLKEESAAAVADMITAKEEEEIADMITGISSDRTSKELAELRDLRNQQKAQARVSRELAGTDTRSQEAEFLEFARTNVATDEFDKLIGLAEETDNAEATPAKKTMDAQLPEE